MSLSLDILHKNPNETILEYGARIDSLAVVHCGYAYFSTDGYDESRHVYGSYIVWNGEFNGLLFEPLCEYGYAVRCPKDIAYKMLLAGSGLPVYAKLFVRDGRLDVRDLYMEFGGEKYVVSYIGLCVHKPDFICFRNTEETHEELTFGSFGEGSFRRGLIESGSFNISSFNLGSFNLSNFNLGSYSVASFNASGFNLSSFNIGSFNLGSFRTSSFNIGSFNTSSFNLGSFNIGSFNLRSFNYGMFNKGSYSVSSFNLGSFNLSMLNLGSFNLSSYSIGSFNLGSFNVGSFNLGSFNLGSFGFFEFLNGSFGIGSFNLGSFDIGSFNISSFNLGSFNFSSFNTGSFCMQLCVSDVTPPTKLPFITTLKPEDFTVDKFYQDIYGVGSLGYGLNLI